MSSKTPVPLSWMTKLSGERIGSFELVRTLGSGGMGVVYLATDLVLRRDVALKLMPKSDDGNDSAVQAGFLREARAAARLSHPNVVQIFQVGETAQFRYIAMEYVSGTDTLKLARQYGNRLPEDLCIKLMREAADALQLADTMGICHRDIKPSNLLLTRETSLKIADFGLASQANGNQSIGAPNAKQIMGTPYYMSPEQWQGEEITPATDIYSLGCTLYRLLIGTPPYGKTDFFQSLRDHCTAPIPDPMVAFPEMEPLFADLLQRCMAKHPDARPKPSYIVGTVDEIGRRRNTGSFSIVTEVDTLGSTTLAEGTKQPGLYLERTPPPVQLDNNTREVSTGQITPSSQFSIGSLTLGTQDRDAPTYQSFYGLQGYPFSDIRRPSVYWQGGPFGQTLSTVANYIAEGKQAVILLGDRGSGRTFLCDLLPYSFPYIRAFRVEPQLLLGQPIMLSLCQQNGVEVNPNASMRFLLQAFLSHALPASEPNAIAVIVIDTLDPRDKELLADLNAILLQSKNTRLSLLLVGSNKSRISHAEVPSVSLRPMTQDEMVQYITYRMRVIGGNPQGIELDVATRQFLHQRSKGSPKLVNVYCHNALTIAALRGERMVSFESFRLGMKRKVYLTPTAAQTLL